MNADTIQWVATTLAAVSTSIIAVGIFFWLLKEVVSRRDQSRYDESARRAELSLQRVSLENQLERINDRLLASEARWKEVNHLIIDSQRAQSEETFGVSSSQPSLADFMSELGTPLKDGMVDPRLIFVLTPFNERERGSYSVVQAVCNRAGLRCARGDEEHISGAILPHIVSKIAQARIIVANISGRNPNVYYELGIAHAMAKPTILLARSLENVPFDLQSMRIVVFENLKQLDGRFADALLRLMTELNGMPVSRSD